MARSINPHPTSWGLRSDFWGPVDIQQGLSPSTTEGHHILSAPDSSHSANITPKTTPPNVMNSVSHPCSLMSMTKTTRNQSNAMNMSLLPPYFTLATAKPRLAAIRVAPKPITIWSQGTGADGMTSNPATSIKSVPMKHGIPNIKVARPLECSALSQSLPRQSGNTRKHTQSCTGSFRPNF